MMATRQRRSSRSESDDLYDDEFSDVSEEDILAYMAEVDEEETEDKDPGFLNLQTGAGLGLIALGGLYTMQLMGLIGVGTQLLATLVAVLPWLAGILIMLTGFGVLSWSPAARRRRKARERAVRASRRRRQKTMGRQRRSSSSTDEAGRRAKRAFEQAARASSIAGRKAKDAVEASRKRTRSMTAGRAEGRRLAKAKKGKKIAGVANGIAQYFGIDPTVVRIAFVLASIFGQGAGILIYLILSFALPNDDGEDTDDPIFRVIRD